MSNPTPEKKPLTAAEAAKAVRRPVTAEVDGKPTTKMVAVKADEVIAFRDYGTHVVVVTKDGQKFSSDDQAAE